MSIREKLSFNSYIIPYILLSALIVSTYLPALNNEFVSFDDDVNIYESETLSKKEAFRQIWFSFDMPSYLPLTGSLWYIERQTWGAQTDSARYFHGVSIFLHTVNVFLVYLIIRTIGFDISIAWLISAFFAVHPWRVENVAWATEQKSLLSAIFICLSWLGYLKATANDTFLKRPYIFSLIMFSLSLLSKTTSITFPFIFLMSEWLQGHKVTIKKSIRIIPYLILGAVMTIITLFREFYFLPRISSGLNISFIEHILLASRTSLYYLIHFISPPNSIVLYDKWDTSSSSFVNWIYFVATVAILFCSIFIYYKKRAPVLLFSISGYYVLLLPVSGLINMPFLEGSFLADRYLYLPLLFLLLGLTTALKTFQEKIKKEYRIFWGSVVSVALIFFWGIHARKTTYVWHSSISLWENYFQHSRYKNNPLAYNNMGLVLAKQGKTDNAIVYYNKALDITFRYTDAHINLGALLAEKGDMNKAIEHFTTVVQIDPLNAKGHYNLGLAFFRKGNPEKAAKHFSKAYTIFSQQLGPNHTFTINTKNLLEGIKNESSLK